MSNGEGRVTGKVVGLDKVGVGGESRKSFGEGGSVGDLQVELGNVVDEFCWDGMFGRQVRMGGKVC